MKLSFLRGSVYIVLQNYSLRTMLSLLRAPRPPMLSGAADNLVTYEDGASSLEFRSDNTEYCLKNVHSPFDATKPQSIMVPPLHYHIYQAEHFHIVEGSWHVFRDAVAQPWRTLSASDPDAPKTAVIPKQTYHTIRNASATEPMVLEVSLIPQASKSEERFFRNFFGHLDDCRRCNQQPSFFQLMVLLRCASTPLGLLMPARWLGIVVSKLFRNLMGWWGYWVLGYQDTYPQYYIEKKAI